MNIAISIISVLPWIRASECTHTPDTRDTHQHASTYVSTYLHTYLELLHPEPPEGTLHERTCNQMNALGCENTHTHNAWFSLTDRNEPSLKMKGKGITVRYCSCNWSLPQLVSNMTESASSHTSVSVLEAFIRTSIYLRTYIH